MVLRNSGNEYVSQETAMRLEKAVNFKESRGISNQHWIASVLYEPFCKINWTETSGSPAKTGTVKNSIPKASLPVQNQGQKHCTKISF